MLMCGGSGPECKAMFEVNSGVIFLNVRSRYAKAVCTMWRELFESIFTSEVMRTSIVPFGLVGGPLNLIIADQAMLSYVLRLFAIFGILDNKTVKTYVGADYTKFNYNGDFIKQLLRPDCGVNGTQIEERINLAKTQVTEVLARFKLVPLPLPIERRPAFAPVFIGM